MKEKDAVLSRAKSFLAIMIIISVIYGGFRSVSVYYNQCAKEFEASARESVENIVSNAGNVATVADRYDKSTAKKLKKYINVLEKTENYTVTKKYLKLLSRECGEVYEKTLQTADGEWDAKYLTEAYYNTRGYISVLCCDEYNETAEKYNKTVRAFPAFLFAAAGNKQTLPVFSAEEFSED